MSILDSFFGGGNQTQTVTQSPWPGITPYLTGSGYPQPQYSTGGNNVGNPAFNRFPTQNTGFGIPGLPGPTDFNPNFGSADYMQTPSATYSPQQQQPYVPGILPEAANLYQNYTPQYYPGSTVSPFTPYQSQAQNLIANYATQGAPIINQGANQLSSIIGNGNPLTGSAYDTLNATAQGQGFNSQPFMNAFQSAYNQITPQIQSQFNLGNRSGSGLAQAAQTQALGNAFAGLYGQERQNQLGAANALGSFGQQGIGNQLSAINQAPNYAQLPFNFYNQLNQIGGQQQLQNQAQLSDQVNRFQFQQNLPYYKLGQYQSAIQPFAGAGSSTTQPLYQNKGAGILGGALAGSQLAPALGLSGPAGIGLGALLGLL